MMLQYTEDASHFKIFEFSVPK